MNAYDANRRFAERMKRFYPPGTRVLLNHMDDPYAPVPPGTKGTIQFVDDIGQLHMNWDNGRTLALVPGEDDFRKLTPQELAEENSVTEDEAPVMGM